MIQAVAEQPINNFEGNAGTFIGGKNLGARSSPVENLKPANDDGATTAFRKFMEDRKSTKSAKAPKRAKAAPSKPGQLLRPTDERMAKDDKPKRTTSGFYRAPAPIERLRDQGKLDPNPRTNLGMFEAAEKLYAHFYRGGLKGIQAQDISRCAGSGDGGACQFPANDDAMFHRQKFREATRIMGWHPDHPFRGSGRLVVDVVCFEMPVLEAGKVHTSSARTDTQAAKAMEKLCEGLFILAAHWRLI